MAMEAKADYLNLLEKKLSRMITAADLANVMTAAAEVLDGFEMRATFWQESQEDGLLECYLDALRVQGRSQKTIERYGSAIKKMLADNNVPTRRVTVYHLRTWLAKEKARGIKDSSIEGTRQIFSAFFGWLLREGLIEKNPVANLGTIRVAKKKRESYSEVDLEKLRQACTTKRDQAIVAFLGSTGCRISEVMNLNRNDVDLQRLECIVRGKGNKERRVYLDPVAGMMLGQYLEERKDDCEALFIGRGDIRLQPDGVRKMLKRIAKLAGVENVHPHRFRRTLATNLSRHGMPIQEVARVLGHDKLDTTMKYVVMDDEDVRSAYRRYA